MPNNGDIFEAINALSVEMNRRFDGIEQRLDRVEQRLDKVEQRLDRVEQRLDGVEQRTGETHKQLSHFTRVSLERMETIQKNNDFLLQNLTDFSDQFWKVSEEMKGMEGRIIRQIQSSLTALNHDDDHERRITELEKEVAALKGKIM